MTKPILNLNSKIKTDSIPFEGTPPLEECVQVTPDTNYLPEMRKECERFQRGIRKYYALAIDEIAGIWIRVVNNAHDFGTYFSINVDYDNYAAKCLALFIENTLPETWRQLENDKMNYKAYEEFQKTFVVDEFGEELGTYYVDTKTGG